MNQATRSLLASAAILFAGLAVPASGQTPNPPTDVRAFAITSSHVVLSWTNDESAAPYSDVRVERMANLSGTWTEVAVLSGPSVRHTDSLLTASTDYHYRVRAFSSGVPSTYTPATNVATRSASVQTQFASSVIAFSTEFSGFEATDMIGAPDVYPLTADNGSNWSPSTEDGQREFIELGFSQPMQTSRVEVFETLWPGTIDTIYVRESGTGLWHVVYSGMANPAGSEARSFSITFPLTSYQVDAVRLAVNSPAVPGWNEFDAIAISNPSPVSVHPSNPGAFFFDGVNDRVRITDFSTANPPYNPSAYAVSGTALTVEAWIYPMSVPASGRYQSVIARTSSVFLQDPFRTYGLLVNTSSSDGVPRYAFHISDGVTPIGGGNEILVQSPMPAQVGTWTHIAGSYDGNYVRLYVNGELVRSLPFTGLIGAGSTGLYVGGISNDFFHGLIDEVRLWNNTRTAAQIQVDLGAVQTGTENAIVGYWPLNVDNTPAALWTPDLTSNSNDLIIQNGAKTAAFPFGSTVAIAPTNIAATVLSAVNDVPYNAALRPDGWPFATVSLVSGPSGMVIDGDTLRWTPTTAQSGNHEVILDATNVAGTVRDTIYVWVEQIQAFENDSRFDVTNRGKIGAFGQYGKGIVFNGLNGVYTADVSLVDRNNNKFAGGLYTGTNSFAPASGFTPVPSVAAGFTAMQTSFTDEWEANRIGVRVIQTSYIKVGPPDHQYLIAEYRVVNESGAAIDDIYFQLTADFDVGLAGNNLAVYDTSLGLVYAYEVGGATNSAVYGIQLLRDSPSGMAAWTGTDAAFVRSTANLTTFTAPMVTPSDVRGQFSVGPYNAAPLDTFSVMVAYLAAPTVDAIRMAAAQARQLVVDPATIADLPIVNEVEPNGSLLQATIVGLSSTLSGEISYQADVDYYEFTVPVAGPVQIIGQLGTGSALRYRFEIYNSGGGAEYSSWWYIPTELLPYGYVYLNPGTYKLRVLHGFNYTSYPSKVAFPKGSKAAELEQKARLLARETKVLAPADTSGSYQIILRPFEPVLGRPAAMYFDPASDNSVGATAYFFVGEDYSDVMLDYGTTSAYGNTVMLGNYFAGSAQYWFQLLSGLMPSTSYHARLRMVGSLGTSYSRDYVFTTPSASPTWARQILPDALTYYLYDVDAVNERTLYAAGSGVFRTTNGGLTWQGLYPQYTYYHYSYSTAFYTAADGVSVGEGTDVILTTSDSGSTWINRLSFPSYTSFYEVGTFDGSNIVAFGGGGLVARSTDFGVTWTVDTLAGLNVSTINFLDASTVVMGEYNGNIWRSTDGGDTWTLTQTISDGVRSGSVVDANTVFFGGYSWIWSSTDAGVTWTNIGGSPEYNYGLSMVSADSGIATSLGGRIFSTSNGWQSYSTTASGAAGDLNAISIAGSGATIVGSMGSIRRLGPVFEQEPNGTSATASEIFYNAQVEATLDPVGDQDWYFFSGAIGDTVEISTFVPTSSDLFVSFGTNITFYDPLGSIISTGDWFYSDSDSGVTDRLIRILPATGAYRIRVSDPRGVTGVPSPNATYTLRVQRRASGTPAVVSAGIQGLFHDRVYLRTNILPMGGTTNGGVEYGTTPALGSFAAFEGGPVTGFNAVNLRAPLTGLDPGTTYYYRPTATNEYGTHVPDTMYQITTPAAPEGWVQRPTGNELTLLDISFAPYTNYGMTVGVIGNIRRTENQGLTWDSIPAPVTATLYGVASPMYGTSIVVGFSNQVIKTTNGGISWYTPATPFPPPATTPAWYAISFMDQWNGIIGGQSGLVMRTTDGGESWVSTPTPIPGGYLVRSIQMVNGNVFVAGLSPSRVAVSTDAGLSWTVSTIYLTSKTVEAIVFFDALNGIVGSSLDSVAYRTSDGGQTWLPYSLPGIGSLGLVRGSVGPDGIGYLTRTDGAVYISNVGGSVWTPTATGSGTRLYGVQSPEPGIVYGAGIFGMTYVRDIRPSIVTMYVDMRSAIKSGLFNPALDTVAIRGGTPPLSWTGFNHTMTDLWAGGIDSIYQVTFEIPDPGILEYKFIIRHRGTDLWERATTNNRMANLPRGSVAYGHTFDDRPAQFSLLTGQYDRGVNTIGLWHMDEDTVQNVIWGKGGMLMVDHSSQGNHGSAFSATSIPGRHGRARLLSGQDSSWISLDQGIFYNAATYSFTAESWVFLTQYPGSQAAVLYSGGKYDAFVGISPTGKLRVGIRGLTMTTDSSVASVELNRWVHVAMQYDATGQLMRGYIDGDLVINRSLAGLIPSSTFSQAFIGGGPGYGGLTGAVDEVRVSNIIVDPTQFNLVLRPPLAVSSSGNNRVSLSWQASPGALPVQVYRIYRGSDSSSVALFDSVSASTFQYVDTTAVNGADYYYRVTAVDVTGFEGRPTFALPGTPLPIPAITATIPVRNSVVAPAGTNISLQFNTDLDSASVHPSDIRVVGSLTGPVTLSVVRYFPSIRVLEAVPDTSFVRGEEVEVTVKRSLSNLNGDSLAAPMVARFRVAGVGGTGVMTGTNLTTSGAGPSMVAGGDIDNDGDIDVVSANSSADNITVYRNDGRATMTATNTLPQAGSPFGIVLTDVNGDGLLDLAVANSATGSVTVWTNTGGGNFSFPASFAVGSAPLGIAAGDLNGDGATDLAVTNSGSNSVSILTNNGDGTFVASAIPSTGNSPVGIAIGDLNRDGRLDIAVTSSLDGSLRWYRNTVSGFVYEWGVGLGAVSYAVAVADMNGDGNNDLITGTSGPSNNVRVDRLNASGAITGTTLIDLGSDNRGVAAGDFNGDGLIDLIVSDRGQDSVRIIANNGSNNYSLLSSSVVGTDPWQVVVGDLDGDGDLDVVTGHQNSSIVTVLRNNVDTDPPSIVTGLTVSESSGRVDLAWTAGINPDVVRYVIFRAPAPSVAASRLDSVAEGVSAYADLSVSDSTVYVYYVKAVDAAGNESPVSVGRGATPHARLSGEYGSADTSSVFLLPFAEATGSSYVVSDVSNGQVGTSSTGIVSVAGRFGAASSFDGSQAIGFGHRPYFAPTGSFTVEAWVKPAFAGAGVIVRKDTTAGSGYELSLAAGNFPKFQVMQPAASVQGAVAVPTGDWTHVAGVFDGSQLRLYVNGELVSSTAATGPFTMGSEPLAVGATATIPPSGNFIGLLDEIRISQIARTPSEFNLQRMPRSLTAATAGTTINLSWQNGGGSSPLLRYRVYRGADSTSMTVIDSTATTSYSNSDLDPGTQYFYRVTAVDNSGFESARSFSAFSTTSAAPQVATVYTFSGDVQGSTDSPPLYSFPNAVVLDRTGNAYVADGGNGSVRKITPMNAVTTLATGLGTVQGIAVDSVGNVYTTDGTTHRVWKITASGVKTVYAGSGSSGFVEGDSTTAAFNSPFGIAIDGSGNLFVADRGNNVIRKITPDRFASYLAGNTGGSAGFNNGTATTSSFSAPSGLSFDNNGNLLVADRNNNAIRKLTFGSGGSITVSTVAGLGSGSPGSLNGTTGVATFNQPTGVAVDGSGSIYVADKDNNLLRRISSLGLVSTVAGSTVAGMVDDTASSARFTLPTGLTIDGSGALYVADWGNHRIRRAVTNYAPSVFTGSATNVTATTATLNGFVNPNGFTTTGYFEYGSTNAYGTQTAIQNPATIASFGSRTASLTGLTPNTVYHYRQVATNESGTTFGADITFSTALPAPGMPQLSSPDSGSTNVGVTPTLAWLAGANAESYRLQISLSSDFSTIVDDDSTLTTLNDTMEPLLHDTLYYWHVRSQNVTGNSAYTPTWFFRTIVDTPDVPTLASPANAAGDQPVAVTLSWNASPRATTYHIQVSASNTFGVLSYEDSTLTGTSVEVSGLANLTTYYWRVRAKNIGGASAYATTRQFTTIIAAPAVPTLASPADSAIDQSTVLTLSWNAAARASTYHLQLAADEAFSSLVMEDNTITGTSRLVGTLSNATTYFWRVRAINVGGTTSYSSIRRFTTIVGSPDVPVLAGPDSGATNVPTSLTAVWLPAARAEQYHIQLSTSNAFASTIVNDSTLTDTSRAFSALGNDLQYYWRVRSRNTGGSSSYSPVWTFRTVVSVPEVPTLSAPLDSVIDQPVTLPFSWNASARATSYRLEVSVDSLFQSLAFVDSTTTSTTRAVGPLGANTRFYWRVRAQNAGGNSAFSPVRTFRTIIEAPQAPSLVSPDTSSTTIPTTALLRWRSSARAESYRVQVSLFNTFGLNVLDQSGITDTTLSVGPLNNDTTYYWRVSATNGGGTSAYSNVWKFRTIVAPPDVPALAAPLANATDQPISLDFSWSTANRATSYRLEVSESNDFSSLYFVDSTIIGTTRQVTLVYGTTYYWRVRAQNVGGAGSFTAVRTLTTIIQLPGVPVLFSPDSGTIGLPLTVDLRWWSSPRASSYNIQVSQNSNFSTLLTNLSAWTDTVLSVGPLTNLTQYYWRVSATNVGGTSAYSAVRGFQTVIAAPAVPTLVTPSDNATNVPVSAAFAWTAATRASTYRLQVSTDASFATGVLEASGLVSTQHTMSGLTHDTPYFWRVQAENAGGESGYTSMRQFRTVIAPPSQAPTLTSPVAGAQSVAPSATYTWGTVAGATTYHIQLALNSAFTGTLVEDSTLTTATFTPTGMSFDTPYFWRVRGKNAGGPGPWSSTRDLRTAPAVPLALITPSPVDFGSVEAGSATSDRTLTLSNNGGVNLNVSSITLAGTDASSFGILSGGGSFSVLPGATHQITVRFSPQSTGAKTARLVVATNDTRYPSGLPDTLSGFATDNTPPYNPSLAVNVTPSTWTNQFPITISWTPEITDVSSVTNVWTSVGSAPTVGTPGTSSPLLGQSFTVPTSIPRGRIPIFFYFEDGVGNRNPSLAYQAVVQLDDVPLVVTHDTTSVPEVTVQSGVASPDVTITGQATELSVEGSGVKSFTLEYRRIGDAAFTSVSLLSGSFTIPAATFVQNGGPVGVDYRLVALDSANNRTATKVYSINVRTVEAPPPQPTPLPAVATLTPGTDIVKAYRLFSVPYDLVDKRPSQIFPLSTNLGAHEQDGIPYANWRLQRYSGGIKEDYETFKDQQALVPGSAFFLIVKNSNKRITVGAASVANAQEMNDVGIPLQTGWNLVGNPLLKDIAIDSLRVTGAATIQQRASFTGSGAVSGWDLNPTVLRQWEGVAIKVSAPTNLLFRTIGSQPGIAEPELPIGRLMAREVAGEEGMAQNWFMEFGAYRQDNDMTDLGDGIGMVTGAQDGVDRYDHFQPPFVGNRNVALYFENGEESMMQDIRPPNEEGGVWEMKLVTGDRGARVKLVTSGADYMPNPEFEAFLIDLDEKMAYDLKTTTEVMVNSKDGRRNFRIVVGQKQFVTANSGGVDLYPQEFQLFTNYPNPFNPETVIRYTVADRGGRVRVSLKVYDMLGREVAVLVEREQSAGYFEVPFRADQLSSGPYFYRLQVTGESGSALYSRVLKMMLVK